MFPENVVVFDEAVLYAVQSAMNPLLNYAMIFVTFFGNPVFWILLAAAAYWLGKEHESFYIITVALFSSAIAGIAKVAVARPRPDAGKFVVIAKDIFIGFGFPSGHAVTIAAYTSFFWKKFGKPLKIAMIAALVLVPLSRLYLGAHFPSDVVAGAILGLGIGWLVKVAENSAHEHLRPTKLFDSVAIAAIIAVALIAVGWLEQLPLSATLLGFYAGFFLSKEKGLKASAMNSRERLLKILVGYSVMLVMLLLIPIVTAIQLPSQQTGMTRTFVMFGLMGLWISFLFPWIWEKAKARLKQ